MKNWTWKIKQARYSSSNKVADLLYFQYVCRVTILEFFDYHMRTTFHLVSRKDLVYLFEVTLAIFIRVRIYISWNPFVHFLCSSYLSQVMNNGGMAYFHLKRYFSYCLSWINFSNIFRKHYCGWHFPFYLLLRFTITNYFETIFYMHKREGFEEMFLMMVYGIQLN